MTDTKKKAEFKKGDQVTHQGDKYVVVNQGGPGGAVLVKTPAGVTPFKSTFLPADELGRARSAAKKAPAAKKAESEKNPGDKDGE